jgi:hypothetical protein
MTEKAKDCRTQQNALIVRVQVYDNEMNYVRFRTEPISTDYIGFLYGKIIKPSELLVRSTVK